MSAPLLFGNFTLRGKFFGGAYALCFDATNFLGKYFVAGPFTDDFIASVTGIARGIAISPTGEYMATYDFSPIATIVGPAIMLPQFRRGAKPQYTYGGIIAWQWSLQSDISSEMIANIIQRWEAQTPP